MIKALTALLMLATLCFSIFSQATTLYRTKEGEFVRVHGDDSITEGEGLGASREVLIYPFTEGLFNSLTDEGHRVLLLVAEVGQVETEADQQLTAFERFVSCEWATYSHILANSRTKPIPDKPEVFFMSTNLPLLAQTQPERQQFSFQEGVPRELPYLIHASPEDPLQVTEFTHKYQPSQVFRRALGVNFSAMDVDLHSLEQLDTLIANACGVDVLLIAGAKMEVTGDLKDCQPNELSTLINADEEARPTVVVRLEILLSSDDKEMQNWFLFREGNLLAKLSYGSKSCPQMLEELQSQLGQVDQHEFDQEGEAVLEKTVSRASSGQQIVFVTRNGCAICLLYEVLLEHLLAAQEFAHLQPQTIVRQAESQEQAPDLIINGQHVGLASEFNTLAKARSLLRAKQSGIL